MRTAGAVLLSALSLSCTTSQLGASETLRFGQLVEYAETKDFSAPVAAGQELWIAIQGRTKPALLNDYPYLDGTLTATRLSDNSQAELQRIDLGKFKAVFAPGRYQLKAKVGSAEDTLDLTVVEQVQLRLARVDRKILTAAGGGDCISTLASGAALELKSNQSLIASIVPADAAGNPLLGILRLQLSGEGVQTTPTSGLTANEYVFSPAPGQIGLTTVSVKDEATGQLLDVSFTVSTDSASCPPR